MRLNRLGFLAYSAVVIASGRSETAAAILRRRSTSQARLPAAQHAWTAALSTDEHGNPVAPRFDRLLFFDVAGAPTAADVRRLEAAMRTLERLYPWSHQGLLFTLGWGPHYFEQVLRTTSPIPHPVRLSDFESPSLDAYDACLHLASDDERRLAEIEAALIHGGTLNGAARVDLPKSLHWRETRSGFVGAGLPARHQEVSGIPGRHPVSPAAPLYMGFKSGFRKNQATEDDVTIADGPFAGGTTMHVSYMRLRLDSWYSLLDEKERVARMYSPETTPAEVSRLTDDAPSQPGRYARAAARYGVVGHSQTSARARRNGRPRIIRRDFNTADGGTAGLHFVAVQRSIADFVATRKAMNAANAPYLNPAITDTVNNGINEFIFVLKRANYIIPPRRMRSFPLLPGRTKALA
jgi:deferrochelatase/peroxidase EfeB